MSNTIAKTCLECGDSFHGRVDKKFCSDQCRSAFNNHMKKDSRDYVRRVNYILRKNHRILGELLQGGQNQIAIETLKARGFDFNHFTSLYPSGNGVNYYCYEHGFARDKRDECIILLTKDI
jgi:hypothetical protein